MQIAVLLIMNFLLERQNVKIEVQSGPILQDICSDFRLFALALEGASIFFRRFFTYSNRNLGVPQAELQRSPCEENRVCRTGQ